MVFWLAVLVGGLFAWSAVQIGFYGAWILFFNLLLSAYMAIFVAPAFISDVPDLTGVGPYGGALTVLCIAIATLCISYGMCYAVLAGQLRAPFPSVLDNVGAGIFGFLSGFLVCSFVGFVFSLTPLSQWDICKTFGLDHSAQDLNRKYICGWCDSLNFFVGARGAQPANAGEAVQGLLEKTTAPKPKPKPKPKAPPKPADEAAIDGTTSDADNPTNENAAAEGAHEESDGSGRKTATQEPRERTYDEELGIAGSANKVTPRKKSPAAPAESKKPVVRTEEEPPPAPEKSPFELETPPKPRPVRKPITGGDDDTTSRAGPTTPKPEIVEEPRGFSGLWQSLRGVPLRIEDDGQAATVELAGGSSSLQFFSGKLSRPLGQTDSKTLTGEFKVVFVIDGPKEYKLQAKATLGDTGELTISFSNWPRWVRNKYAGRGPYSEIFVRQEDRTRPSSPNRLTPRNTRSDSNRG